MGDLYSTALAVLCLEVYYRYSSAHKTDGVGAGRPIVRRPEPETREPSPSVVTLNGEEFDLAKSGDRSRYLRMLSRDKGLGAVPALLSHLADESLSVRNTSLSELGRLKSKDAVKPVQAMLTDPVNDPIRITIIDTLGSLGDRSVHPTLIRLLNDADEPVRRQAQSSLTRLAGGKDLGVNRRSWEDWFARNP
jgi:hypothetical protein